jgi:thioredoxin 2
MKGEASSQLIKCPACGANNRVRSGDHPEQKPVCGRCKTPLPEAKAVPVTVTDANFAALIGNANVPVLLDLWAAWCGPCRMVAPTIELLAKELSGRVLVGKLDVDANPATSSRFGVQSIPTLLILKDGREAGRLVGVQSKEAILKALQPFI